MTSTQKHTAHHASLTKRYTILKPTVPSATAEEYVLRTRCPNFLIHTDILLRDESTPKPTAEGLTMYDAIVDTRSSRKRKEDPAISDLISGISGCMSHFYHAFSEF